MSVLIKDMDLSIRPRERLLKYGVESLGSDELLAIILR
jgi:DNA repair protein RadC